MGFIINNKNGALADQASAIETDAQRAAICVGRSRRSWVQLGARIPAGVPYGSEKRNAVR